MSPTAENAALPALEALGAWAQGLRLDDVPPEVVTAARAQLAHIASRLACTPGAWSDPAAAYVAFDGDGHVLGARTGAGLALLRGAGGRTVGDVLRAAVIGMEIGAAVGLSQLLTAPAEARRAAPAAAAGAAALAALDGADGPAIARAVGHAIVNASGDVGRVAAAVRAGLDGTGTPDGLRVCGRVPDALAPGRWRSRALVLPRLCAPAPLATAVEGVSEILRRHVKAADKRLRAEQVERIEVRVCLGAWAAEAEHPQLGDLLGRLVAFHALGPEERASTVAESEGAQLDKAAEIAAVAERVEVVHDWGLTVGMVRGAQPYTGPLRPGAVRAVRGALRQSGHWPRGGGAGALELLRARPDRLLTPAASDGAPLAWPVQIKLYTTRGGWWPERRQHAENVLTDGVAAPFDAPPDAPASALSGAP